MNATTLKTKVHKYVDEADAKVLGVICNLLEVYREANESALSKAQQDEVLKRSVEFKKGKIQGSSLAEVRKRLKKKVSL
jgi:hypothetical protein